MVYVSIDTKLRFLAAGADILIAVQYLDHTDSVTALRIPAHPVNATHTKDADKVRRTF